MTGGASIIGIAIFTILGLVNALFSLSALVAGSVAGLVAAHKAMIIVGGVLSLGLTWLMKPLLFTVLDGTALVLSVIWVFVAGAVWTAAVQIAWRRFGPAGKRV